MQRGACLLPAGPSRKRFNCMDFCLAADLHHCRVLHMDLKVGRNGTRAVWPSVRLFRLQPPVCLCCCTHLLFTRLGPALVLLQPHNVLLTESGSAKIGRRFVATA